jgi:hypothetical protein
MLRAFVMILILGAPVAAQEPFTLEQGYTLLIGKDLTGWKVAPTGQRDKATESLAGKTETPTKRFSLKEGVIIIDAKVKGDLCIVTEKIFEKDTTIKFDFKPGKTCNNDLYFRGIKFDIKPGDIKSLKVDEWNQFVITLVNGKAEFQCNGTSIKTLPAKPAPSNFAIRAEAGSIEIRHLRYIETSK